MIRILGACGLWRGGERAGRQEGVRAQCGTREGRAAAAAAAAGGGWRRRLQRQRRRGSPPAAPHLDLLGGVQQAGDVVVDGLLHRLALLQGLDLLVHQVKVLGLGVQRSHARGGAALAVQAARGAGERWWRAVTSVHVGRTQRSAAVHRGMQRSVRARGRSTRGGAREHASARRQAQSERGERAAAAHLW